MTLTHERTSAILASILLHEELGHIGRVGCGLCLIGSFIIVLHAPEDKEIKTVDEILHYAVQPGKSCFYVSLFGFISVPVRFPPVLLYSARVFVGDDLPCRTSLWLPKPISVYLHLLSRRLHLYHGRQRIWSCPQINSRW